MASSLMSSVPLASAKPTPFPTGLTSSASNARLPFAPPLCVVPLKARSGAVRCAAKDDFRDGVQKNVEGTVESVQDALSDAGGAVKDAVGSAADRAEGARSRATEEGEGFLEETRERGAQVVEELREKLRENAEGAKHKGQEVGSQVEDALGNLKGKAEGARDAAGEKIEGAVDNLKGKADNARNKFTASEEVSADAGWAWAALSAGTALAAALGCAVVLTAQPALATPVLSPNPQFEVARSWYDNLILSGRVQKDKPGYGESVGQQKSSLRQKPEGNLAAGLDGVVRNVDARSDGAQGDIREADRRAKGAVGGAVREVDRRSKGAVGGVAREADRRSGGAVEGIKRGAGEAASRVERQGKDVLQSGREALERAGASFQESSLPAPLTNAVASADTNNKGYVPTLPPRAAIRGRSDAVQGKDQKEIREVQAKIPKAPKAPKESSKGPFASLPSKSDVDQTLSSAKGKVESAAQSVQGQGSGALDSAKGAVKDAQSVGLEGAAQGLKERAQNLLGNANAKNQEIGSNVKERAVKAKDVIEKQTKDALGGFSVYPTSSGSYAFNFSPQKAAKDASDSVTDAVKGVQAQGQGVGKEAQGQGVGKEVQGSVQSATDSAKSGADSLADTLQRNTGEAIDFLKGKAKATAEEGPRELAKAAGSGGTSPDLGKAADNTDRGSYQSADNLAKEESKFSTETGGFEPGRLLQQEKEGRIL